MLHPYTKLSDGTDIAYKVISGENITIYAEKPDAVFGFKSCVLSTPNFVMEERFGFTDSELADIVYFVKQNIDFIKQLVEDDDVN